MLHFNQCSSKLPLPPVTAFRLPTSMLKSMLLPKASLVFPLSASVINQLKKLSNGSKPLLSTRTWNFLPPRLLLIWHLPTFPKPALVTTYLLPSALSLLSPKFPCQIFLPISTVNYPSTAPSVTLLEFFFWLSWPKNRVSKTSLSLASAPTKPLLSTASTSIRLTISTHSFDTSLVTAS